MIIGSVDGGARTRHLRPLEVCELETKNVHHVALHGVRDKTEPSGEMTDKRKNCGMYNAYRVK